MGLSLVLAGLALAEAVTFAVHLKNVHVVGEPVEKRAGQAFGSKGFGPFVEGQVAGDYVSTQFLDDGLVSFQAEYRTRLAGRFGFVAFASAGAVDEGPAQALTGDYKAAAGIGLRIRLSKTFPLDYAIDLAGNEDGEQLLYISVGQRF